MKDTLTFNSEKDVRFSRILRFIIPTYLTSLFNTVYTIIDSIFVSGYVGTNALAAINIVYPIVNILTGIALIFATGGSSITALYIGGNEKEAANRSFSVSFVFSILLGSLISACIIFNLSSILLMLGATDVTLKDCKIYAIFWLIGTPIVIGKELFTYFIRVDGSPAYSFATALTGGVLNIVLDFFFIKTLNMGIMGAALATILGLAASFFMGIYYFIRKQNYLVFTLRHLSIREAFRCMINGLSEFVDQIAIAVTTIIFNRTFHTDYYVIQNCRFTNNRARGVLLQGSHGLVENNLFENIQGAAIQIETGCENRWSEGQGVNYLLIRGNVIRHCDLNAWQMAVIYMGVYLPGGRTEYPIFTNIELCGNTIVDCPRLAGFFSSCENVRVHHNTVINALQFPLDLAYYGSSTMEEPIYGEHYEGIFQFAHSQNCSALDNQIFSTIRP